MKIKNTNRFGVALKIAIVFFAVGYIVLRLSDKEHAHFTLHEFSNGFNNHSFLFITVVFLMPVNWMLEAIKWKLIASSKINVSMKDAIRGVLAGVTIGTATPNRVGEFAGRIFMLKEGNRKDLLMLSFISSFCQVFVTIVIGIVSYCLMDHTVSIIPHGTLYFLVSTGILFCMIPLWLKFLPEEWRKRIDVVTNFPSQKLALALFISTVRYLVYVGQFLLLFYFFENSINAEKYFFLISISYFVVTIIPTFTFTEVFVRGTVAGTLFETAGYSTFDTAFSVAALLWTINVAIPSLVGTFFVFKLKFFKTEKLQ